MKYNIYMKRLCFSLVLFLLLLPAAFPAMAQNGAAPVPALPEALETPERPEVTVMPEGARCFAIYNQAPYMVYGTIVTNYYLASDGTAALKRSNFHLESKQRTEFCSYGPFYGTGKNRLKLVLRTLIPIFSCEFTAEGELTIFGLKKPEGGTKTWASCI